MRVALRTIIAAAAALLVVASPALGQGQQQAYGVDLTAAETSLAIEPEGEVTFTVTVRNTGTSPLPPGGHTIVLNLTVSDPERFQARLDVGTVTLAPGATRDVTVTVESLTDARDATTTVRVDAVVTDPPAQLRPTDFQLLTVVQPGSFLTPLTSFLGDKVIWVVVGGIGVLVVILVAATSKKKGGVAVRCAQPSKSVEPGGGASYPIVVENVGRDDDVVSLSLSSVPEGWETYLSKAEVSLDSGDEETVFLTVKAPRHASPGARVAVRALAESGATPRATDSTLTTTTVAGEPSAPDDEPEPAEAEVTVMVAPEPKGEPEPPAKPKRGKGKSAEPPPAPPATPGETRTVRRRRAFVEEDEPRMNLAVVTDATASPVIEVGESSAAPPPTDSSEPKGVAEPALSTTRTPSAPVTPPAPAREDRFVAVKRRKAASA